MQDNLTLYKGIFIILAIVLGSVALITSLTMLDQNANDKKTNENSPDVKNQNQNYPRDNQANQGDTPIDTGSQPIVNPNDGNIVNPGISYKINSISTGMVVDYSLNITQFSDHMMSLQAQNDSLRFTVSFVVTEQAQFTFNAYLYNSTGYQLGSGSNQNYYSPGTDHVATIDFSGYTIRQSASTGKFNISLQINKYNGTSYNIFSTSHVHTTDYYNWNWFAIPPSAVPGSFTFTGTDLDTNGLNDVLTISGSLNNPFSGNFRVYYAVTTSTGSNIITKNDYYTLPLGINTISTQFKAWRMNFPSNYNGTYSLYIQVFYWNSPGWQLMPNKNVSVSQSFNRFSWDSYPVTSASVASFSNMDPDANGKFNSFQLELKFDSRLSGSFSFNLYAYDNATGNYIISYSYSLPISVGSNYINVSISTLSFYQFGANTSYYFSIYSGYFYPNQVNDYTNSHSWNKIYTTNQYYAVIVE